MSNEVPEGNWPVTVLHGRFGENDKGSPQVQVHVRYDEGPGKGRTDVYEDQVNNRSALYISRSCRAVGWKGGSLDTLAKDIEAWVKATGGKTTAEVKHIEVKKGKRYDEWVEAGSKAADRPIWVKVNSLGRGAQPLKSASKERLSDADEAMRTALIEDGFQGAPPSDDAPPAAEDDIPFATIGRVSLGEIARVLR